MQLNFTTIWNDSFLPIGLRIFGKLSHFPEVYSCVVIVFDIYSVTISLIDQIFFWLVFYTICLRIQKLQQIPN